MAKEAQQQIMAELKQLRVAIQTQRELIVKIHDMLLVFAPDRLMHLVPICVTLQPGDCHTFHSTPGGQITITNEADEHGMAELKWNGDVFTGEVQSTSTRIVEPHAWPATICNVGNVPLKVCPA